MKLLETAEFQNTSSSSSFSLCYSQSEWSPSHHLSALLFLISTYNSFSKGSFIRFSPHSFPLVLPSLCCSIGIACQTPQCSFSDQQRSIFWKATHVNSAKHLWRIPRYLGRASSFSHWDLLFKADELLKWCTSCTGIIKSFYHSCERSTIPVPPNIQILPFLPNTGGTKMNKLVIHAWKVASWK